MAARKPLIVNAVWDDEAKVWVATSDDVPGLATEAETYDALVKKLMVMIPELLDETGYEGGDEVPFRILSELDAVAPRVPA
jgi:predicted RNase H-like HicB family nuclease